MAMRRFFSSMYSSDNNIEDSADSSNTQQSANDNETPSKRRTQFMRGRFGKAQQRSNSLTATQQIDESLILIEQAANSLADTVQEIISDTSHLTGDNLQGYILLVEVLEGHKCFVSDNSNPNLAAMNVLLSHIGHPKFIEICYQTNIATGLFQALRLLRMLEMKHNKHMDKHLQRYQSVRNLSSDTGSPSKRSLSMLDSSSNQGITFKASKNICALLQTLCSEPSTIEQIRPLLTKIFTFPLGLLPVTGKHMQSHIAQVTSAICRTGFTSQQIWYLHDIQMMTHMIRQMHELTSISSSASMTASANAIAESSSPIQRVEESGRAGGVLKGLEAEKEGLWNVALKVLAELVSCTIGVSTVLYHDFETVGGLKLLAHILQHSSSDHFLHTLNTVTLLFFDPSRQEESTLTFASVVSTVLEFLLTEILKLERPIYPNDPLETLIFFSKQILRHSVLTTQFFTLADTKLAQAAIPRSREYVIQGMCYSLLTLYSNDALKSITLEETYCFLPALILSLPTLILGESFSAILTTINYVCQCGFDESVARMPLLSLCAATTTIVHQALDVSLPEPIRLLSVHKLELCFISMDAINKSNPRFAMEMLRSGFLKTIAFEPFELLVASIGQYYVSNCSQSSAAMSQVMTHADSGHGSRTPTVGLDEISLQTYQKIINLLVDFNQKSPFAAEEIRKSGIHPLLRRILGERVITGAFVSSVLRLSEELSKVDTVNLQECIVAILALTRVVAAVSPPNYLKISFFFLSLWKILLENEESCVEYLQQGGIDAAMEILQTMHNVFDGSLNNKSEQEVLSCLESLLRYMSLLVFHANFRNEIPLCSFHWQLTQLLINTRIFSSGAKLMEVGIELVFSYLTLFSYEEKFFNPSGLEVVSCLFCFVPIQCSALLLKRLFKYLEYVPISSAEQASISRNGSYQINRNKCMQLHQTDSMISLCKYVTSFRFYPKRDGSNYVEGKGEGIVDPEESLVYELFLHLLAIAYQQFPSVETFLLLLKYGLQSTIDYEKCQSFHVERTSVSTVLPYVPSLADATNEHTNLGRFDATILKVLFPQIASHGVAASAQGSGLLFPLNPTTFPNCVVSCTGFGEVPSFSIPISKIGEEDCEDFSEEQQAGLASSLALFFSESTVSLPQNAVTLACWFKLERRDENSTYVSVVLPGLLAPEKEDVKITKVVSSDGVQKLSLLCLELGSDAITVTVELNIQTHEIAVMFTSTTIVTTSVDSSGHVISSKKQEIVLFKPILMPNYFNAWCHCVLVLKRVKRFLSSANTTQCLVYMNGAAWSVVPSVSSNNLSTTGNSTSERRGSSSGGNSSVEFDCLTCIQNSELRLGFSPYSAGSIPNTTSFLLKIASVAVFPDVITSKQIALMYLKGPQYTGFHQASSTLTDSLSTLSSHTLRSANALAKNALNYLNKTSLSGLEYVVEPKVEAHKESIISFDIPPFVPPIVIISATCCILSQPSFMYFVYKGGDDWHASEPSESSPHDVAKANETVTTRSQYFTKILPTRYSVFNIFDLDSYSTIATLNSHHSLLHPTYSLGHCVACIGGPSYLLPLLLQVQDEESLQLFLTLLNYSVRSSLYNLKVMQNTLTKLYSFLFAYLPKSLLTQSTLHSLLQLTLDISLSSPVLPGISPVLSSSATESWLLVDSVTMSYLVMNNFFWDFERNFNVFMTLLRTWKQMLIDEKFTTINAMRLSSLGATRWILCLVLQIVQNKCFGGYLEGNRDSNDASGTWEYVPRTALELADYRDVPDEFLHTAMMIVRILMASELRYKDMELVTNTIQYTFNYPQGNAAMVSAHIQFQQQSCGSNISTTPFDGASVDASHPFCTCDQNASDPAYLHRRELTAIEFLRIHLIRLILNILDDNTEDMKAQQNNANSALRRQSSSSTMMNASGATLNNNGGGSNTGLSTGMQTNNPAANNGSGAQVSALLEKFEIFREKCSMAWLFSIFERAVETNDVATKAYALRLIGILIQQDAVMYRDFQALHGCQFLFNHLSTRPQEIPILLPLVALLFRLPMSLLLYPIQIQLGLWKLLQLFELDECNDMFSFATNDTNTNASTVGTISNSFITDFCLPILHVFHECLIALIRCDRREIPWAENGVHLMLGIMEYSMEKLAFFKSLMQHKLAIEMHMTLYLSCTGAYVEDGPQIYCSAMDDGMEPNLVTFVVDDYVPISGTIENKVTLLAGEKQELKSPRMHLQMATPQISSIGKRCTQLSINILTDGLTKDYENSKVLQYLLTSFPSVSFVTLCAGGGSCILSNYEYGYQLYVMELIEKVVYKFTEENDTNPQGQTHQLIETLPVFMSITRNMTNLVHLIKGGYLYDESLIKLLSLSFYLLERMAIIPSNMLQENVAEQYLHIFRELIQNARFLSLLSLQYVIQGSVCCNEKMKQLSKLPILSLIRSNLQHLFPMNGSIIEDNLDSYLSFFNSYSSYSATSSTYTNMLASTSNRLYPPASSPIAPPLGSIGSSNSVTHASTVSTSGGLEERSISVSANVTVPNVSSSTVPVSSTSQRKTANMNAITQLRTERNKINSMFFVFLMWYCSQWILEEDKALRMEAIRILAYLTRYRKNLSELLVGNATNQMIHKVLSSWWNNGGTNEGEFDVSVDLFKDGFMKLVPNKSGKYELFLGNMNSSTGLEEMSTELEDNRYADFAYWISYHQTKFEKLQRNIDISLGSLLPNLGLEEEDLLKFLSAQSRLADLWKNVNHAEMAKVSQNRREAAQRLGEKVSRDLAIWKNHCIKEMTFGMAAWQRLRPLVLCNPILGKICSKDYESGLVTQKNMYQKIMWRVDFATVTPELTHKKLIPDLSPVQPALFGIYPSKSSIENFQINEVSVSETVVDDSGAEKDEQKVEELLRSINAKGILRTQSTVSDDDEINGDEVDAEMAFMSTENDNLVDPAVDSERLVNSMVSTLNTLDTFVKTTTSSEGMSLELLANHSFEDEEGDEHEEDSILMESYQSSPMTSASPKKSRTYKSNNVRFSQSSPERIVASINNSDESAGKSMKLFPNNHCFGDRLNMYSEQYIRSQKLREVIKGLINVNDWKNCRVFNIQRINGLEAQPGILFFSESSIHIINNLQVLDTSKKLSELIFTWIPPVATPSSLALFAGGNGTSDATTTQDLDKHNDNNEEQGGDNDSWIKSVWNCCIESYQAFLKISIEEIYSFFKRRYELKYTALEITDIRGLTVFFSCQTKQECDFILTSLLERDLPASIFNKMIGLKNLQLLRGVHNMYSRLISFFLAALTQLWQHYEITNFEYLMYLNSCAGRSCVDLTQYPVFPWVLQDYTSEELQDLEDPSIYRDFTKPMGAMGERRATQYYDRYLTMQEFYRDSFQQNQLFEEDDNDEKDTMKVSRDGRSNAGNSTSSPPPFFYGTHYSCAGYVLHYLVRLQPFANMSLTLQGGHFDKPDRLFYHMENSWKSASQENLQDVRELIPEFFYLPDFLKNQNGFHFGTTQRGNAIGDVVLPPWSRGSAEEFIRLHRAALESNYVSNQLPAWIDLIFGFKQRGKAAIEARNVFLHITYEGEVDVDKMDDPVLRVATLSQINNFGQTPSQLFATKAHPKRNLSEVLKRVDANGNVRSGNAMERSASQSMSTTTMTASLEQSLVATASIVTVDHNALSFHSGLAPPLTVVGTANQLPLLNKLFYGQVANYQITGKFLAVSDIRIAKDNKLIACSQGSIFLPPYFRKLVRYQAIADGLCLQNPNLRVEAGTTVNSAVDLKDLLYFDQLHAMKITCCVVCKDGEFLATGSEDRSVRVWRLVKSASSFHLQPVHAFAGHLQAITCVEIVPEYHLVLSGDAAGVVHMWDYAIGCFVRTLGPPHTSHVLAVSMNTISGFIATITKEQLRVFHLNGALLSYQNFFAKGDVNDMSSSCDRAHFYKRNQRLEGLKLSHGSSVVAPPCGEWQDGVVAVTGHQEGHVLCWKLTSTMQLTEEQSAAEDVTKSPIEESLHPMAAGQYYRRLYIASTPTKVHRSAITTLRLSGGLSTQTTLASSLTNFRNNITVNSNTHKEVIHRAYAESRNLELLIGDAEGYVSRWSTVKLDQLSPGELQSIVLSTGR